jgi:hypothetical protein
MATETTQISTQDFFSQTYKNQDTTLISTFNVNTSFISSSYIEFFVYDNNFNILSSDYSFSQYTIQNNGQSPGNNDDVSEILLDPENILISQGYTQGQYNSYFNFFNKQIGSNLEQLYISEISSDRTEIRLDSTVLTILDVIEQTNTFIQERENSDYFLDFYLNFGENKLFIANNIELDNQDPNNPTILIKLYEPLPEGFDLNSLLWVVTLLEESLAYQVTFEDAPIVFNDTAPISDPNFNLDLKDRVNNSTLSLSYTDLTTTLLTSSQNQLNSLLEEKEIDINIDYTDFSEFTHFSSAKTRLENFYYKVSLIEEYSSSIATLNNTTNSPTAVSNDLIVYETKINDIITNFDGYDYYLYYSSGSYSWPKTTSEPPYLLYTTGSTTVLNWFGSNDPSSIYYGGVILSASIYDEANKNNLYFTIPEYLREDPNNDQYVLFIDMMGQFYDNIWIYYKDVTQKYNADNRLEYGISKDIVADAIRDFGLKLYQNNFSNEDLYTAFLGLTPDGALFPFPNITGSLPTPSGYEYVDTLISASNDYMPLDDVNKSLYKRIYHNLPYLLKAKGTLPALRTLITSYGIPDTILRINEYGGKDKINTNDWDYWQNEFNYAFYTTGSNHISSSWSVNADWNSTNNTPETLTFRFKTEGLPTSNIPYSQSLWNLEQLGGLGPSIILKYTGSGYSSGSYSGSIIDPYYQYATLEFCSDPASSPSVTASIYFPFFDGGWWSVMVTRENLQDFTLYAGNKIYEGGDNGTLLGFYTSSYILSDDIQWANSDTSFFAKSQTIAGNTYNSFSGSLQEIRYYNTNITEPVFKDYIMNPHSTEGTNINLSPNELIFRASLGGELYTESISIHPKVTGSWATTSSFPTPNFNSFNYFTPPTFVPNTEYFFYDQPIAGIKNSMSDKIRVENIPIPSGDTLSPFRSLAQFSEISQSYTANTNLLEVAFSPQDQINEDIMDQIGYFNIGEYIGDPRLRSSSAESYPSLDNLRNEYFEKYTKNYDLIDYIRLIKFFDNSLFKMIKDFVPARTSLASGIVVKQHLLERNKYPQPQVNNHSTIAYYPSGSSNNQPLTFQDITISGTVVPQWNDFQPGTIENFSGGTGGTFNVFNYVANTSQSWYETIPTVSGSVIILHSAQDEFYDGEFSGSNIIVTTQSLNTPFPNTPQAFNYKQVHYYGTGSNEENIFKSNFLNPLTLPQNGEMLFMNNGTVISIFNTNVWVPIYNTKYIKISKIDCNGNDQTIPLENLTKIYVYNYLNNTYVLYTITNINELSSCFLYEANLFEGYTPSLFPNQVFDYTVSSSITASYNVGNGSPKTIINWNFSLPGTNLPHYGTPYFNTSSGILTFENTPNTNLIFSSSITTLGSFGLGQSFPISLIQNRNNIETVISSQFYSTLGTTNILLTASLYPIQNDQYYIKLEKPPIGGSINIESGSLLLTQSRAVSSSNCDAVIFEPYITTPNFYNSDDNALLNNVDEYRLSTVYQDVDYSTGITTPTNFGLLISGSAIKAPIQDSNYTTKRHIIPRYEGSKSTSQYLNVWTEGDSGTYGKTPTVESLKTMVAYCDSISGWPPERMNASAIHVLYLIKQDGTVIIPNTSANSLTEIQGTFMSGEKLLINSKTIGSGEAIQSRNIIRGGTRIEPILYTQYGHSPASWNVTMSFTTDFVSSQPFVGSYIAKSSPSSSTPIISDGVFSGIDLNNNILLGAQANSWVNNYYTVNQDIIDENVSLTIGAQIRAGVRVDAYSAQVHYVTLQLVRERGGIITILDTQTESTSTNTTYYTPTTFYSSIGIGYVFPLFDLQYLLSPQNMQNGDKIYIQGKHQTSTYGIVSGSPTEPTIYINQSNSSITIGQIPSQTNTTIYTNGTNTLWGYPDNTKLYAITCSNSTLNQLYNNGFTMVDITGSGFNPISLPWSVKYGDEFRFEGNEISTFMVRKAYDVGETDSNRVSPTGSVEIQFNDSLSSSSINLNHFLIRRYVDDASLILMEGFKPTNSSGPYIVRPEYVVPELNKSVDQFILDLTQKGLIT